MVRFSVVRFGYGMKHHVVLTLTGHKLKQLKVKIVIIICQTSNQSATMEQNYCSSKFIF
jgi:dethiobiotin synthetase